MSIPRLRTPVSPTLTPSLHSGWILLALAIALVNSSSSIIVLYVLLTSLAWILMLFFVFKPLLVLMCRRTGSFGEKGPTQGVICAVVMLTLASSFITDRIGIHAIFGAFIVGLIVPREIRSSLTEKIEDLVSVLFLPLVSRPHPPSRSNTDDSITPSTLPSAVSRRT